MPPHADTVSHESPTDVPELPTSQSDDAHAGSALTADGPEASGSLRPKITPTGDPNGPAPAAQGPAVGTSATGIAKGAVDATTAIAGIEEGNAYLDQGFFPARWDRTTPLERQYLRAIVNVSGSTASRAAAADELGKPATSLSPVRQSLIEKGIIFAERRGHVSFTVPNTDAFIRSQIDVDDPSDD